jgi:CDP-diacylglycerol--serine O-phosphatidyltransferase
MVSRLPVFSGKKLSNRVPREMVLPIFVVVVLLVALLISYPWVILTLGTLCYLASLPFGWLAYQRAEHEAAREASVGQPELTDASKAPTDARPAGTVVPSHSEPPDEGRPSRLN